MLVFVVSFQLNDILRCKDVVTHFAKTERVFKAVGENFSIIEEAVRVLKMFFITTKALEQVDFTLSDFYGYLLVLKENLKNYLESVTQVSNLADCLQTELESRLPMLVKNPLMLCAIFLDRRYSTELSRDEKELAVRTLIKIWEEIETERGAKQSDINTNNNDIQQPFEFADNNSVLEAYFRTKGVELVAASQSSNGEANFELSNAEMYNKLENFDEKIGRHHASKNVLEYWEEQKSIFPEIYLLSTIINAVPATQATTERCFSALDFIFDECLSR